MLVKKPLKNNVYKIYCEKRDLVLESRESFDKHLDSHSSGIVCEVCLIDTAM